MTSSEDREVLEAFLVNSEDEESKQAGRDIEKIWRVKYSSEALNKAGK